MLERAASIVMPPVVSEQVYKRERDIDVNYDDLDFEVHIATLDEEGYIKDTLKSLHKQDPVKNGDVDLVLVDSYSNDDTVDIAKEYVDDMVFTPKGLLTARNKAINARKPDVVMSADAGDIYTPGWIDELAKPFERDNVVASYGNIYSKDPLHKVNQKIKHSIVNTWNLPGNNSAIRVSALRKAGMFNEDIDQQSLAEMVLEEQIFAKMELSTLGEIAYRPYAAMYKSQRRKAFTLERNDEFKEQVKDDERF
jgi:glycosyltransferase involved in cell wall biosynthesis